MRTPEAHLYNMEGYTMANANKGYDINTGLYSSRYYARKAATGADVVIKVCGGYTIMTAADYNIWRNQR
jgi:hypothetical protein